MPNEIIITCDMTGYKMPCILHIHTNKRILYACLSQQREKKARINILLFLFLFYLNDKNMLVFDVKQPVLVLECMFIYLDVFGNTLEPLDVWRNGGPAGFHDAFQHCLVSRLHRRVVWIAHSQLWLSLLNHFCPHQKPNKHVKRMEKNHRSLFVRKKNHTSKPCYFMRIIIFFNNQRTHHFLGEI